MNLNATLLGQMGTFGLFVWFTMKYIWPPVIKAMQDRQKKIAEGLDAAERGVHALELSKDESVQILRKAREEASSIVDQAASRGAKMVEEAKELGRKESNRLILQGQAEVDQSIEQAKVALRRETAEIAIESAAKIFGKKIDKVTHEKLLDELIEQI